jgi:hypothetical protein
MNAQSFYTNKREYKGGGKKQTRTTIIRVFDEINKNTPKYIYIYIYINVKQLELS